jgi:hypothetical protein
VTRSTTALRRVALCAAAASLVLGCGVHLDDEPRALNAPQTTTTAPPNPSTGRFATVLYYVADGELMPVVKDLPDRALTTVLTALLEPPASSSTAQGLGTSIPAGTELLGFERAGRLLSVNLSESFDNVVGLSRQQAIGQIVLTMTELSDVTELQFRVEGGDITVSSPVDGDSATVNACDFEPIVATVEEAVARLERLPVIAIDELDERLRYLDGMCPEPRSRSGGR